MDYKNRYVFVTIYSQLVLEWLTGEVMVHA